MTLFVGDIHGEFEIFHKLLSRPAALEYPGSIIQVGDFGHHPGWLKHKPFVAPPRKIYWIDGNHEWFPDLKGITKPTELYKNCVYIPRGTVMEVDGRRMGFLGGANSIDRKWRTPGYDWFVEEQITGEQVEQLVANAEGKPIEVLVTHAPPLCVVPMILNSHHNSFGGVNAEANQSSVMVELAWGRLGRPVLVCGHFHSSFTADNVHVLDINEFKEL